MWNSLFNPLFGGFHLNPLCFLKSFFWGILMKNLFSFEPPLLNPLFFGGLLFKLSFSFFELSFLKPFFWGLIFFFLLIPTAFAFQSLSFDF